MKIEEKIRQALRKVMDPELGVSIVDMGLIYNIDFKNGEATIEMTLTSLGCPLAGVIDTKVKKALEDIPEVKKLSVKLVFDPPWSKDLMSDELKAEFGF